MFPDDYYKSCEKIWYGDKELSEANHIFKNVTSFDAVDETQLLKQNLESYDYKDIFRYWVSFTKRKHMKGFLYFMY